MHAVPKPPDAIRVARNARQGPVAGWVNEAPTNAFFGYKAHVGVDQGSGLVRSIDFTSAKINDGEVADGLICGDEAAVYADKAYEKKERRARLKAAGIKDRIMHRRHKHIARLPRWQEKRNALIARRRAPVEAVFSAGKRLYGLARARYASLVRNAARTWPSSRSTTCAAPRCWRRSRNALCWWSESLPLDHQRRQRGLKCALLLIPRTSCFAGESLGEGGPKGRMRGPSAQPR